MIDDGDWGAIGGMKIDRGNRSTRRKTALAPLCPPQIPHDLTWAQTREAAVESQLLTAWAMARPKFQGIKSNLYLCRLWRLLRTSASGPEMCSSAWRSFHQFRIRGTKKIQTRWFMITWNNILWGNCSHAALHSDASNEDAWRFLLRTLLGNGKEFCKRYKAKTGNNVMRKTRRITNKDTTNRRYFFTYHNNSRQANEGERSECRLTQF
jgi:hypothetical protein